MSHWPDAARAAGEARILDYVPTLLSSSDAETRMWTCGMLGNLALHRFIEPGVKLCAQIVSLLRCSHSFISTLRCSRLPKATMTSMFDSMGYMPFPNLWIRKAVREQ
jgi:hypothetical protein